MKKFKKKHFQFFIIPAIAAGWNLFSQEKTKEHFELVAVWEIKSAQAPKDPDALSASIFGDVYVADTGNNRILKFSPDGNYQIQVGGFGWESNQFDRPVDISARDGLNVYVADYNNQRIQRFSKKLEFISSLGNSRIKQLSAETNGQEVIPVGYPSGVAVSSQGDLFFSDDEKGTITKINKFGKIENTFGGFAQGRGKLRHPTKLCVTKSMIYIVDVNRIVQFDYFGNYIADFGEDVLKKPTDVAAGGKDRIYVSDAESKTVFLFDQHGAVVTAILSYTFEKPVSVDAVKNKLFVLDKSSVLVFAVSEGSD